MINEINSLRAEIAVKLPGIKTSNDLENFRLEYLVKKGKLTGLFDRLKDVSKEDKPVVGKELNLLRQFTETEFNTLTDK